MSWTEGAGVLFGGEGKVLVYSSTSKTMTADDLIGELAEAPSGIGAQREVKEYGGYHYTKKHKTTGLSTPNDVSFTENLTTAGLTLRRGQYDNNTKFYTAFVDASTGTILYGLYGQMSQWGMELPNGDVCKLTYTMAIDDDAVTGLTVPQPSNNGGEDEDEDED